MPLYEVEQETERVILVGVSQQDGDDAEDSVAELAELVETAGAVVVGTLIQKRENIHPETYVGTGKVFELEELIEQTGATGIVCDDELSPAQLKNLEEALKTKVMDRTLIILDIFAARASTSEGKIQVELAQLKYRLSRLSGLGRSLSRLGGGIGTRGPGEKKLEMDRRLINSRVAQLNRELKEVQRHREVNRQQRKRSGIPVVAVVGYTNAGKSSLMNALCENADVYAQDQLFATLDPTIRKMQTDENSVVLLVDTVGFIRKLPHDLINAFRSTLEESVEADLILHVIDVSDEDCESQIKTVDQILESLGVADKPVFKIFNKCDVPDCSPVLQNSVFLSEKLKNPYCYFTSAKTRQGLPELKQNILKQVIQVQQYTLFIPYTQANLLDVLHRTCKILSEEYTENGTILKALLDEENRNRFSEFIKDE